LSTGGQINRGNNEITVRIVFFDFDFYCFTEGTSFKTAAPLRHPSRANEVPWNVSAKSSDLVEEAQTVESDAEKLENLVKRSQRDLLWLYKDDQGEVQGPFSDAEMNDWFEAGYLGAGLLVKRVYHSNFVALATLPVGPNQTPFFTSEHDIASRMDSSGEFEGNDNLVEPDTFASPMKEPELPGRRNERFDRPHYDRFERPTYEESKKDHRDLAKLSEEVELERQRYRQMAERQKREEPKDYFSLGRTTSKEQVAVSPQKELEPPTPTAVGRTASREQVSNVAPQRGI
jgi:hypothetical protein